MSTTLTINQLRAGVGWAYVNPKAYGDVQETSSFSYSKTLANGTGAGSASKIAVVQADGSANGASTLAASSSDAYDLSAFTDPFGNSLSFTTVRAIYLENTSSDSGTFIKLEGGASNPWVGAAQPLNGTTPVLRVPATGCLFLACNTATGFPVDGTHKTFKVTNEDGTNAATYKLVIVGE